MVSSSSNETNRQQLKTKRKQSPRGTSRAGDGGTYLLELGGKERKSQNHGNIQMREKRKLKQKGKNKNKNNKKRGNPEEPPLPCTEPCVSAGCRRGALRGRASGTATGTTCPGSVAVPPHPSPLLAHGPEGAQWGWGSRALLRCLVCLALSSPHPRAMGLFHQQSSGLDGGARGGGLGFFTAPHAPTPQLGSSWRLVQCPGRAPCWPLHRKG